MKKLILYLFLFCGINQFLFSQEIELLSPDKKIKTKVRINDKIFWSAELNGNVIIEKAEVAMVFTTGKNFGLKPKLKKKTVSTHSSIIKPTVPHKNSEIKDEYNLLSLQFKGNYILEFRAYNHGAAYRFIDKNKEVRNLLNEKMELSFPEKTNSFFPKEESMYSHNERIYLNKAVSEIKTKEFCSLPVMFTTPKAGVLFTETALHNYPGLFLQKTNNETLEAIFPKFVLEAKPNPNSPDRNQILTKKADYIAQTEGYRTFPWRVFIISDNDGTFVESNLTYQLSEPPVIEDTKWIKPGKVAWDWYNANNIFGVDFKSGLNTETYKYYIDFASANNIEYVILDEGWTKTTTEILDVNPEMDVKEIIRYAKSKNVEIILWVLWKPLDENTEEILKTYKSWGAVGIKVDFMQRNDQYMVNSYEKIARIAAKHELLVDFHGAFKPSGLRRKYPNVVNYEGVKGSENNKWSADITPTHNVTIPFIRMAAGPMDYTPGAMINVHKINHHISFERPMSLGTRAHQVAMYVVYEAPLQMMCESPSIYKKEQETVDFITKIPTVWDETKVLEASVGEYIAVARRNANVWYIGAMTNEKARELELKLSFLGEGNYKIEIFKDGINANRFAQDYTIETKNVSAKTKLKADLASGGGWTAIISKI